MPHSTFYSCSFNFKIFPVSRKSNSKWIQNDVPWFYLLVELTKNLFSSLFFSFLFFVPSRFYMNNFPLKQFMIKSLPQTYSISNNLSGMNRIIRDISLQSSHFDFSAYLWRVVLLLSFAIITYWRPKMEVSPETSALFEILSAKVNPNRFWIT